MDSRLKYVHFPFWFFSAILLYVFVRVVRMSDNNLPDFLNSYLTDLICLPLALMICLNVVRFLKRDAEFKLGILPIAILFVEYSLIFELIAPYKSNLYTGDAVDVLMYLIGAIAFYFLQSKKRTIIFSKQN